MDVGGQTSRPGAASAAGASSPAPGVSADDQARIELLTRLVEIVNQIVALQMQQSADLAMLGPQALAGGAMAGVSAPVATTVTGAAQAGRATSLQIASFNALGSSHTAAGGNKPGYRAGTTRTKDAVEYLDKHGVDVAGFQEFQGDQQAAFKRLKPGWKVVAEKDNAIVWNDSKFKLVKRQSLTIPYFEGQPRKMPVVQLEDRTTGAKFWVVDVHNPANTKAHPDNEANRDRATKLEQDLVKKLGAGGLPVFVVGDFNERAEARDKMTSVAGTVSAAPKQARTGIDWIFGSGGVKFSDYAFDTATQQSKTSDHPMVVATATF